MKTKIGLPQSVRLSDGLDLARSRRLPVIALVFGALAIVVVLANVLFGINEVVSDPVYVQASPTVAMPLAKNVNVVNVPKYPYLPIAWVGKIAASDKGKPFSRSQKGLSGSRFLAFHVRERLGQWLSPFQARKTNDGISNGGWRSSVVRDLNRHLAVSSIHSDFFEFESWQSVGHLDVGALGTLVGGGSLQRKFPRLFGRGFGINSNSSGVEPKPGGNHHQKYGKDGEKSLGVVVPAADPGPREPDYGAVIGGFIIVSLFVGAFAMLISSIRLNVEKD